MISKRTRPAPGSPLRKLGVSGEQPPAELSLQSTPPCECVNGILDTPTFGVLWHIQQAVSWNPRADGKQADPISMATFSHAS